MVSRAAQSLSIIKAVRNAIFESQGRLTQAKCLPHVHRVINFRSQSSLWRGATRIEQAGEKVADKVNVKHVVERETDPSGKMADRVARKGAQNGLDKRARNTESQQIAKRQKLEGQEVDLPVYATKFSQEEIETEGRKPKRKVAVMIGYSGSGYKGMQLNYKEKTIEGDLFSAFVSAGAISKANADDPKKSSFVRCARTDKGVHAAGNVISLKLIIEDPDIVSKINEKLSPQIRVWGIEQVNGSFNAYKLCDSRIYEYLIPSHCFLPPYPKSFLGKNIIELAKEANDLESYKSRQSDVESFWPEIEEKYIRPIFGTSEPDLAEQILTAFYEHNAPPVAKDPELLSRLERYASSIIRNPANKITQGKLYAAWNEKHPESDKNPQEILPLEVLVYHLKTLHNQAKKAYRISPERLARVRSTLSRFVGSHRFHNYTIDKTIQDPSASRFIKSFKVNEAPIIIGDTEWLSLKVHGQSFMMHQIRKMVSMAALSVRCGCYEGRIQDTYSTERLSIPKAPSLGLLLERPVFDEYNKKLEQFGRATIDFKRYEKQLEEFKQREIYERIFREEERDNTFQVFFAALDGTKSAQLFYLSLVGPEAVHRDVVGVEMQGLKDFGESYGKDGKDGNACVPSMRQEANATVEAEIKGAYGDKSVELEDVDDISSEDETGGHDEG